MQGLAFILIIALLNGQTNSLKTENENTLNFKRSLGDKLNGFLENKLRQIMKNGDVKLGVPILDPLEGHNYEFDYKIGTLMVAGKVNEYNVKGISSYLVKNSEINIFKKRINIAMHFPTITAHGLYDLEGFLDADTAIYGSGNYNMTVKDFSYSATAYYSTWGGIQLKSVDLQIHLGKLELSMTGFLNDDQTSLIMSEIISDIAPAFVEEHHDEITIEISSKIIEMTNKKLAGKSWQDLLALLS